jgi:hypothetical protein
MRLFVSLIAGVAALCATSVASAALNVSATTPGGQTTFNSGEIVTIDIEISTTAAEAQGLGLRAAGYDPTILTDGQGTVVPASIFNDTTTGPVPFGGIQNIATGEEQPPLVLTREGWSINLFQGVSTQTALGSAPEFFQVQFIAGLPGVTTVDVGVFADYADLYTGGDGVVNNASLELTIVPEPGTALLMGLGLAGLAMRREATRA